MFCFILPTNPWTPNWQMTWSILLYLEKEAYARLFLTVSLSLSLSFSKIRLGKMDIDSVHAFF